MTSSGRPGAGVGKAKVAGWLNTANALSLARVPLALLFLFASSVTARVAVIALAALSDLLDGWVARRFKQGSRTGEILDPVTDKFFVASVLGIYAARGQLEVWELLVLWARDLYNSFAYAVLRRRRAPIRFRARLSGKLVTVAQMATLIALTVMPRAVPWAIALTATLSLVAMFDYSRAGVLALRRARLRG